MRLFDRRSLLAAAAAAAALPGLARAGVPASGKLAFNIMRDGKPFGKYLVGFVKDGAFLKVTTDADMLLRAAGLNLFSYHHHCEENWQDGKFLALSSTTVRNNGKGESNKVSAVRGDFSIKVTTNKGSFVVPADASPLSHWNSAVLKGTLFNPQDGERLGMTAQTVGRDNFPLADGSQIKAEHWILRGDQTIDNWYDDAGVWTGLRGVLPDRTVLEYRRV